MGRVDKLKARLLAKPKDFTYAEAKTLLQNLGFEEKTKGRTSGSRMKFFRESDTRIFLLHKPHPENCLKGYSVRELIDFLKEIGEL